MKQLLDDLFATIFFLVVYLLSHSLIIAMGLAVGVASMQVVFAKLKGRSVGPMQWILLCLAVVLGALALITGNSGFIMMKPSIAHFFIAAIMLRRGWLARYLPHRIKEALSAEIINATGYAWGTLMIILGTANLVVAWICDEQTWIWFISYLAVGAKLEFLLLNVLYFRLLLRRCRIAPNYPLLTGRHR